MKTKPAILPQEGLPKITSRWSASIVRGYYSGIYAQQDQASSGGVFLVSFRRDASGKILQKITQTNGMHSAEPEISIVA